MTPLEFTEQSAPRWSLVVRRGTETLGEIRRNRTTGRYRFEPAASGILDPLLEDADLEVLKRAIAERRAAR